MTKLINNKLIEQFNNDGYILLKDVLSKKQKKNIKNLFSIVLTKVEELQDCKIKNKQNCINKNLQDTNLSKHLLKIRNSDPELFSIVYDSLQMSNSLKKVVLDDELENIASTFLEIDKNYLASYNFMFRMDPPNDERNLYGWHQDSSYNFSNLKGSNAIVAWIPLHEINDNNGALLIKEKSHNEGVFDFNITNKPNKSSQRLVDEKIVNKYREITFNYNYGDVLLFNNNLIHSSGLNHSSNLRYTIISRYHNLAASDFIPGKIMMKYNQNAIKYSKKDLDDSDLRSLELLKSKA